MHSNNGTGTRKMSLDAMGARLAEAAQKLTPEARERLACEVKDSIVQWLREHRIPITRRNYFLLNWFGDLDYRKQQDSEIEMELPRPLRFWNWKRRQRLNALRRQIRRIASS